MSPSDPSVHGLEQATFGIVAPCMADGGHINDVRICGMNQYLADVVSLGKAHVLPGGTPIDRFEHAGSRVGIAAMTGLSFTGADPNDIRIGRRQSHVSY
ncbi:MAG: hypothetical protein IH892_12600 [Planctomycetes bacterium]|nr:hypothetical protein [Planctomycetota bacterium]